MSADLLAELDLDAARAAVGAAGTVDDLDAVKRELTGKGSAAARVKQSIKDLPGDQKPVAGKAVSESAAAVGAAREARREALGPATAGEPALDLTLGGHGRSRGRRRLV